MDYHDLDIIDLTTSTRTLQFGNGNTLGTSDKTEVRPYPLLHVNTTQVRDLDDPLPGSNQASSVESSRSNLLSARSTQSLEITTPSSVVSTTGSNKFGIMILPDDTFSFNDICKRKIGNGAKMCVRKNCTINHKGGFVASVIRGDIFVQKTTDVVYMEPRAHDTMVSTEVVNLWLDSRYTLDEWILEFALANSSDHKEVLNKDA